MIKISNCYTANLYNLSLSKKHWILILVAADDLIIKSLAAKTGIQHIPVFSLRCKTYKNELILFSTLFVSYYMNTFKFYMIIKKVLIH